MSIIAGLYELSLFKDDDGNLTLYTTESEDLKLGDDVPVLEIQLDEKQVNRIKEIVQEQKFWILPEDVSTPSEDGSFSYITVNLANKSKKVGGLNSDHARFIEIHRYIFNLIDEEDYRAKK